jgi:hypothetical protein
VIRLAAILVLALGAVAALTRPPQGGRLNLRSAVPNSTPIKLLTKSHLSLTADLAWIRMTSMATSVKYPEDGKALVAWGRFVTDLDPRMLWAYGMGGLLGPLRLGDTVYNLPEALDLMERGTRAIPGDFRLFLYLAYTQLDLGDDPAGAAATLRRAAAVPGVPDYVGPLATRLLAQSGQFGAAREFAQQMAESDDPLTRETFQRRLLEIEREEACTALEVAVRAFASQRGREPAALTELVGAGLLAALPTDPLGGQFVLEADGGVQTTSGARLRAFRSREAP